MSVQHHPITFGSVCSGIEAASVAWEPLGWKAAWLSEIEPFPCAVLAHYYPEVPNLGDMTKIADLVRFGLVDAPDVFCGGTPCQAFSVAGLRKSLDDARGNLSLVFCEIANAIDDQRAENGHEPCVVFWENVPGVLSTADNAFGCFLAGLAGEDQPLVAPGGKWSNAGYVLGPKRAVAWRVLDAQYFGVAQRRRRVFVVASARDGFDPAAVLFEWDGVRRDTAPRREAGQAAAGGTGAGAASRGWPASVTGTLDTSFGPKQGLDDQHVNAGCPLFVPSSAVTQFGDTAGTLTARHDSSPCADRGMNVVAFHPTQDPIASTDGTTHCMGTGSIQGNATVAVAFTGGVDNENNGFDVDRPCGPLMKDSPTGGGRPLPAISLPTMQVRRLTPVECERIMGFPDGYTAIPWRKKPASECPDGPRYKALGNSWAVPVVRWIGARIDRALGGVR